MEKPIKPEVLEELDDLEYLVEVSEEMTWWQKIVIQVADEMKKK